MASNNVMIVRHKLLEKLVALWKENQLVEKNRSCSFGIQSSPFSTCRTLLYS